MPFSGMDVHTEGAIKSFDLYREDIREELRKVYPALGREVVRRSQARAPVLTGRLQAGIKQTAAKNWANIKVGGVAKIPYAGPAHWGWDGYSGPWFIWKVGYPQATKKRRGLVADWIYDRLMDAMNKAAKKLNYHLGRDIQLGGRAIGTGG